jgi:hypothetical protein
MNDDQSFLFTLRDGGSNMRVYTTNQGYGLSPALIPAKVDGSSAANGEPITYPGGKYNNAFEGNIIEDPTALNVIDEITVSGLTGVDAVDNGVYVYVGTKDDNACWESTTGGTMERATGQTWEIAGDQYGEQHPSANATFPDKTGWIAGVGGTAPVLEYDSYMVENEEPKSRTITEDLARTNLEQKVVDQWEKPNGVCVLRERLVYSQGTDTDDYAWYAKAVKWATKYTDECGAGYTFREKPGILTTADGLDVRTADNQTVEI